MFYHGFYVNIDAYSNYHYGPLNTETRILSYIGIAKGDIPTEHWYRLSRTLPEDYTWQQQSPSNRVEKMAGDISYFGGYYEYEGLQYVPSWGGSMFEALMPSLFINESELGQAGLGLNGKRHAEIQVSYALNELNYDIWGMSPCTVPSGGYSEFGVSVLGQKGYKAGVITPHATFLALEQVPEAAIKNLRTMISNYDAYGEYGFYDAIDPISGDVSLSYLCLDQAMSFIALDNYLNDGIMRKRFHNDPMIKGAEHLITEERFFE